MKPLFALSFAVTVALVCRAGPADKAILAAMRLSEQPSYAWTTTVVDDASTYVIDGKTEKGGCTWVRLPLVKTMAQRLGRRADPEIEAVFRGNTRCVINTDDGWRTLKELPKRHPDWSDTVLPWPPPGLIGPSWGRGPAFDPLDPLASLPPMAPTLAPEEHRPYSNAQFAVSHPHEELGVIVTSAAELRAEGDIAVGTLTDLGAQLLLVRDGQDQIKPVCAAGVFKLQIKDGIVVRYVVRLEGILVVERKKVLVRQTATTVVKDIGRTTVEICDEASEKLLAAR